MDQNNVCHMAGHLLQYVRGGKKIIFLQLFSPILMYNAMSPDPTIKGVVF